MLLGYGTTGSGSTVYALELAQALAELDHEVHLICHESDMDRLAKLGPLERRGDGAVEVRLSWKLRLHAFDPTILPVTYPRCELPQGRVLAELDETEMSAYVHEVRGYLLRLHARHRFDKVLVNHLCLLTEVAAQFDELRRVPFEVIVHGTALEYGVRRSPALAARVRRATERARAVVALNDSVAERVAEALPTLSPLVRIQPPGTNVDRFGPRTATPGRLTYVGRLTLDKGVHCLLAAVPGLHARVPDFRLDLIGTGKEADVLRAAFEDLAAGDGASFVERCRKAAFTDRSPAEARIVLQPILDWAKDWDETVAERAKAAAGCVRWLGHQDRAAVAEALGESAASVLPSIVPEAHPLSVCEALASGLAVVGTDRAGTRHILQQVEGRVPSLRGRLRVPTEPSAFVRHLEGQCAHVLQSPLEADTRDSIRALVVERFAWPAIAAGMTELEEPAVAEERREVEKRVETSHG